MSTQIVSSEYWSDSFVESVVMNKLEFSTDLRLVSFKELQFSMPFRLPKQQELMNL